MAGIKYASFMGRPHLWGVPSDLISNSKIQKPGNQKSDFKNEPYTNAKSELLKDKQVYVSLKSGFSPFTQTLNNLTTFKGNEKKVTTSQDGYIKVRANRNAIDGTFNITVKQLAEHHQIASNPINLDEKLNVNDTLKIRDKDLTITRDMTYKDLITRINDGEYEVTAYTHGGKIFMNSKKAGEENKIELKDGTSDLFKKTFYTEVKNSPIDEFSDQKQKFVLNTINTAKDAKYYLNGIEDSSTSNKITPLPGLEIELLKESEISTKNTNIKGRELKFTVSSSGMSEVTKLIKKLVIDYNQAASSFEDFTGAMGALNGHAIMNDIYREMRNVVGFSKDGNTLSTYGIQLKDDGTMTVDDKKLTKAFEKQPESAKQFFFSSNGLGDTIGKSFEELFGDDSIISERIKNINSRLSDLDTKFHYIDYYNSQKQDEHIHKYQRLGIAYTLLNTQMNTMKSWMK
ncbi:flagellar hook-associated protein 2 [Bacillus thuringiensis]|uniref:flagellar hook-associated protein 2 n=1 Tax=Bacillus thuringiensis TaxID=1428 RepID=UPI000D64DB9C|nr:flagellar hook-associated protein 2 [Bacillus thuringiensis]MBD8077309.1 flagellar hook-associated protein 2 [Bacillus thuringiensis]